MHQRCHNFRKGIEEAGVKGLVQGGEFWRSQRSVEERNALADGGVRGAWDRGIRYLREDLRYVSAVFGLVRYGEWTVVSARLMRQSGEAGMQCPWRTVVPLRTMVIVRSSRCAVHPWLHNKPMDISAPAGKLGKICPLCAAMGILGRSRLHVWVDIICSPFGMLTVMGLITTC